MDSRIQVSVKYPSRIVCLTEETTETLYLLGEGDRVVGISGYTVRPPEARSKPKVSAFINARFDKIEALKPDLILAFSDLQADIAAELIRRGYPVVTFNQRSIAEILRMIRTVGALVGRQTAAEALADASRARAGRHSRAQRARLPRRPRVFFEEWDDPAHLRHLLGRRAHRNRRRRAAVSGTANAPLAKDRIVAPDDVRAADPEVIMASWCGKAMKKRTIVERPGWDAMSAVRERPHLRNQVDLYPAARPGVADRRRRAAARVHRAGSR